MTRILIVRGHLVNPWELGPWVELPPEFEVSYLLTGSNRFDLPDAQLRPVRARALRDLLPGGRVGEVAAGVIGDRYISAEDAFAWADIVHAEELSFWFAADAARRRRRRGDFRLVQTVWETLPFLRTFRNRHARRNREEVLAATDLFLPATARAADALALEGVEADRIRVCPPGIDVERFARAAAGAGAAASADAESTPPAEHVIVSPGRLVWEKGHQDVLRAVAALERGIVPLDGAGGTRPEGGAGTRRQGGARSSMRLLIVGAGPEEGRLRDYASELGLQSPVEIRSVPYSEMPAVFAGASAMVLGSLPWAGAAYHLFDVPRVFWEEQFGLVLAEAMGSGLDIIATTSGAIPEVLAGTDAQLVPPGDWMGIARALASGPLTRPPGSRVLYPADVVNRYSNEAAASRLADAYRSLLA